MPIFRNLPLKRKLTIASLGTACLALLVTYVSCVSYESFTSRADMAQKLFAAADSIGKDSAPLLTSRDTAKAREMMGELAAKPEIITACIYTVDGNYFEGYSRGNARSFFPKQAGPDGARLESDRVVLFRHITAPDGKRIGTIYLEASLKGMVAHIKYYAVISLLSLGGSLLLTLGFSSFVQRFIALENIEEMRNSMKLEIDRRKQAENTLEYNERRFRGLFNSIFHFIGILSPEGIVLEINQASLEARGLGFNEVLNRPLWEARWWSISPETKQQLRIAIAQAATGEMVRYEVDVKGAGNRIITIDFSLKPVFDEKGRVILLIPEATDLTQRQQSDAKIREQAALLDKTQDAILLEDLNAGIRYWNQSAVKLYGWTTEEAQGRSTHELLFSAEKPEPPQARIETLKLGEWIGEMTQITRDKVEVIVESRWTLIPGEDGTYNSILQVNSNVTEKKKLEAQFLRAQRLDSIGCMAGGIAHDLNNLLAPILMGVSLLRDEVNSPMALSFLEIIESSSQRGANILKHVLTFARGSGGDRNPVQIRHMIKEMGTFIRETFPRNIVFNSYIADNLHLIKGDATQIHQILMNLCVNSRDAMPDGGTLMLEARNQIIGDKRPPVAAHAQPGAYVSIKVSDSGSGIKAESMDKIFDPFFTTKQVGEGTGLGLSVVFGIVKSHGGFITVESEPGKGTSMQVFLPAAVDNPEAHLALGPPVTHTGNGELVLIVDDEPSICRLAATILRKNGYHVLLASDGAEAVRTYETQASVIQLVITDVMMPFVDGIALVKTLQSINPAVNIIASSGQTGKSQQTELTALGVSTFLRKPYTPDQLLESVSKAIH